jgi:hypothetical protein
MHSSIGFLGDTSQAVQDQSRLRQGAVHTALAEARWLALARGSAKWRAFFRLVQCVVHSSGLDFESNVVSHTYPWGRFWQVSFQTRSHNELCTG